MAAIVDLSEATAHGFTSLRLELFADMDRRYDAFRSEMDSRFESFEYKMNKRFDSVDLRFDNVERRLQILEHQRARG
jgi:hypothetical protein